MIGLVAVSAKAMERAAAVGREQSHSDRHPPAALTGASQEPEEAPRQEALAWFVRLHSGEAGAGDFAAHAEWLAADPRNRQEYRKLDGIWAETGRLADPRRSSTARRGNRTAPPRVSRRGFLGKAAGLSAAAAVVAVLAVNGSPDFLAADHYTGTGELLNVALPDGSDIRLDADTAIALDFTPQHRLVHLLRGRAAFDVASDPRRPFTVKTAGGDTTALGTQFIVHQWDDSVTVSVQESAVSVALAGTENSVRVKAGERVSYGPGGLGPLSAAAAHADTAWTRGKLIFEDSPLSQVVADLNRYHSGTIRIAGDDLKRLRVSGIFDVGHPEGVIGVIAQTLPVRVIELTGYLVLILPD